MADATKEILFTLRTVADLKGFNETDAAVQKSAQATGAATQSIKAQTLDLARANGANAEQVAALAKEYDELAATFTRLTAQVEAGTLTQDEATSQLITAQVEAETRIKATGIATADTGKKAGEAAQGFKRLSDGIKLSENGMRITNEKAVMLGNMLAGLTTQFALGADGTQLLASGLTSVAMIMSTGGPWGMAAGFALQSLTALALQWKKSGEEAEQAAKKEEAAMMRTMIARRNAGIEENAWRKSIEAGNLAIDKRVDALNAQVDAEEQVARNRERQRSAEGDLSRAKDDAAVEAGSITKQAANENDRRRAMNDLLAKQEEEMRAANEAQERATISIEEGANKQKILQKAADEAEQQLNRARQAKQAELDASRAKQRVGELSRDLDEVGKGADEASAPQVAEDARRIQAELDEALKQQHEAERRRTSLGRFKQKAEEGSAPQIDLEKYQEAARAAAEAAQGGRGAFDKTQMDGAQAIAKAVSEMQAMVERHAWQRETLATDQDTERVREKKDIAEDDAKKQKTIDSKALREAQSKARDLKGDGKDDVKKLINALEDVEKNQRGKNDDFAAKAAQMVEALKDGTDAQEIARIVSALQQHIAVSQQSMNSLATVATNMAQAALATQQRVQQVEKEIAALTSKVNSNK
jgi:hypothetical protein